MKVTRRYATSSDTSLYFLFKMLPFPIGALSIYLGYRLFVLGVTGQASLVVNSTTVSGQLVNAAPGLFFAIGGFAIVIATIMKGVQYESRSPDGDIRRYQAVVD